MTWRPFEPSKEETKRIEAERLANTCNLHKDCAAADEAVAARGGARHCTIENCEDCFGC